MEHRWNHNSLTKLSAGNCPSPIPVQGMDTHPCVLTQVHGVHTTQETEEFPSHSWKMALCRKHLTLVEQNLFSRRSNKAWLILEKLQGFRHSGDKEHFACPASGLVRKRQNRKSGGGTEFMFTGEHEWRLQLPHLRTGKFQPPVQLRKDLPGAQSPEKSCAFKEI